MSWPTPPAKPVPAVSVACFRGGRVLLVRRANPPLPGLWTLPGGRIEPGEPARTAALRELAEETGVTARLLGIVDVVDVIEPDHHYVLLPFAALWQSGEPVAGDDALAVRYATPGELAGLGVTARTRETVAAAAAIAAKA